MSQTVRQMIIDILLEGPATAKELSARVRIPEKDVFPHLAHIRKSLHHGQQRLVMEPAFRVLSINRSFGFRPNATLFDHR